MYYGVVAVILILKVDIREREAGLEQFEGSAGGCCQRNLLNALFVERHNASSRTRRG